MKLAPYAHGFLDRLPYSPLGDRLFCFLMFVYAHRRLPRKKSRLFNDYLYQLKTSQEILDVLRQMTSDKVLVKSYVREKCGDGLTLKTLGVFGSVLELEGNILPKPCVVKPAHGSGSVVFLNEGRCTLTDRERDSLRAALRTSPYESARERNYAFLRRRLICEPMLPSGIKTKDYKFFCFQGQPRLVQVDSDRQHQHKRNIYTSEWEPVSLTYNFPIGPWEEAPSQLAQMLNTARQLSEPFEFVRVDFFIDEDRYYVGELTHCPESGHGRFADKNSEKKFSELLFGNGNK
ncbi:ATP-grasp fold amidoligase family protein [Ancylobacter polymorphus]|uniref:Uncharacterized protein n=1 Tax=Ancylobacter polymorphus TaxID=223390 RepID=A0A9E6ZZ09_9HYPH|nr:ATP-grasp fold amidoligase family protein [Ancylobacter polymorphus]UOK72807.1 hypothetical protein K9D25_08935 [Ancylobacter polymorphus]